MSVPDGQVEIARRVDILETAKRFVKLKRVGAEFVGPCPKCGGTDRFSVNTQKQLWNCRGCDKGGNVIGLVRHILAGTFNEAIVYLTGEEVKSRQVSPDDGEEEAARKRRMALDIWDSARSIRATLAETYLARREVDLDQILDLDDVLRFAPRCIFHGKHLPCLVSLIRDVFTNEPKAIQRIALTVDGQDRIGRLSLGPTKGGAIKLWPNDAVVYGLVVGEGLETTASAATCITYRGTLLQPAWALLGRINLGDLPVLDGIDALTILVDNDESGDGQKAANKCAGRWLQQGRDVTRLTPRVLGADFNDIVRGNVA